LNILTSGLDWAIRDIPTIGDRGTRKLTIDPFAWIM
jgi:hypothetical protein